MAGKKYLEAKKLVDRKKIYEIPEAVSLVKKTSFSKFNGSIDIAIKLNVDTTKAEQQLRGTIKLPHYFGKLSKILVIDDSVSAEEAKKAGADFFGGDEKIAEIQEGWLGFDVLITSPKFMPKLSKLGKILGPKGLMPNPKLGTITTKVLDTIKEFKTGKSTYRTDTYGNVHMVIGKVDAKDADIIENIDALINFISSKRPSTVKGEYIKSIYLSASMGPSVRIR
ncbi:MAG: 50S ribosomal protein L1 [Mycoplasma sp.]